MIKHHFRTAWKNLKANRFYSLINISGLAIGLAAGIMVLLWVQDELSFDRFHKDYRDIYQLSAHFKANGKEMTVDGIPGPLSVFSRSMPEVESLVRILPDVDQVLSDVAHDKVIDGHQTAFVDSTFFRIFDFRLLYGSKATLFPDNNAVVVTQSTAEKFFGSAAAAMGKTLVFQKNNFRVTGVLQDFPQNSSLHYDALFPMGYYGRQFTANGGNGEWKTIDQDLGDYNFRDFVKLRPGADPVKTGRAFSEAYKKARNGDSQSNFQLHPLSSIHLTGTDGNDAKLKMVRIFMLVGILLLLIAGINYVNLSTARSLVRAREVSIRKIVGAAKRQLFFQFFIETFLLFCLAALIAIGLMALLMPLYNRISDKTLHFTLADMQMWKVIGWAILGTLLVSSIYPAILLSSFNPIRSLKGKLSPGLGTTLFRKMLVIFQFVISVVLIISTLVISRQMGYIRNKDLGFDKSYVFRVPLTSDVVNHIDVVKQELLRQPDILNVSISNIYDLSDFWSSTSDIEWQGKPDNVNMMISQANIDKDFIPTLKIQYLEGGGLSGTPADSNHYILNETAVKKMGLKPPYTGQPISFHNRKGTIIGVVKDFNFQSLKATIEPMLLFSWFRGNILYVRTTATGAKQAIATTEKEYKKYAGYMPFSYSFLDKQFEEQYRSDQRTGMLFNLFAAIAIFISCLGLFGLATYTAQVRIKEVGIRKVLGATVGNVTALLSVDFLRLVLIAIVAAIPLAWWGMSSWLNNFAYRTRVSWWIFLVAGLSAILIALATVSFQAIRAALANPVKSLRTE
ncbi:ABC transporter permease [Compostibacter hankyongensis]|uniref:ABC transporter permease n=1 Tax=Compostibacter hankyongensis TaxID=1007089 RepID=A0ABP8FMG7_9BACT